MDIDINCNPKAQPFTPNWWFFVGSRRIVEALQADFQKYLEMVQRENPSHNTLMQGLFGISIFSF